MDLRQLRYQPSQQAAGGDRPGGGRGSSSPGLLAALASALLAAACLSGGDAPDNPLAQDVSGTWGVFVTGSAAVSDQAPLRADGVCACNAGWTATAPDTGIELWQVTQSDDVVTVADATSGLPIASGQWSRGSLQFTGAGGTWQATAVFREGTCCFDTTGTDGRHRHGIRIAGNAEGCRTGLDPWEAALNATLVAGSAVIRTAAGDVEYRIWGTSGPYLLVMHGGQGGYDQIQAFAPGLIGQGYRVLSWSRPGYLRTPLGDHLTPEAQADVAVALLDALGIDRVAAIGGSAGGPPLFQLGLRHPDRVWALIAESAVSQTYVPHSDYPNVGALIFMFETPGGTWLLNAMFEYATEATTRLLLRSLSTLDPASFDRWIGHVMADPDRVAAVRNVLLSMSPSVPRMAGTANDVQLDAQLGKLPLAGIRTPTLVVHGSNDGDVDPVHAEYSSTTIPGARMFWVAGGSHLLVLADDAAAVNAAELAFLAQHAPKSQ